MDDDITDDMLAPGPAPVNDTAVLLPDSPPLLNSKGPAEAFTTIDWIRDTEKDRQRRVAKQKAKRASWKGFFLYLFDAIQAWLLVILIGIATGIAASLIDIGVEWISDLKRGVCLPEFWLSHAMCCRGLEPCPNWLSWSDFIPNASAAGAFIFNYFVFFLGSVTFATICAWLVKVYAPMAAGSGIPEVKTILGGFVITKFLGGWTLLLKGTGLILSVASGLNLGKEGPLVHVACCIGNVMCRLFDKFHYNEVKKREALSAASAAGVAVAFGAPIGGVLFSLEEVSSYFPHKTMWRSFFCAVVAAMMLQLINPFHTGKLVLFQVSFHNSWNWFELAPFILIGCLGGLIGAFFIKMNVHMCNFRARTALNNWPITEVFVVAAVTALASYGSPYLRADSSDLISHLFDECNRSSPDTLGLCTPELAGHTVLMLLVAAIVKLLLTIFTFGIRIPAGLFVPSLAVGACLGRAIGLAMSLLQEAHRDWGVFGECQNVSQCVTPGIYALIGAASVLGGATRMTVSLVVIMFELTGGINIIVPLIVSVMFSKWVGDAFGASSIYEEYMKMNGYPYLDNKGDAQITAVARDVMKTEDIVSIQLHGNTVRSLEILLAQHKYQGFPLIGHDQVVIGFVSRRDLTQILAEKRKNSSVSDTTRCYFTSDMPFARGGGYLDLKGCVDECPIQVVETTSVAQISYMFKALGLRYCVVVKQARLVGLITKKDILRHLSIAHSIEQRRARMRASYLTT